MADLLFFLYNRGYHNMDELHRLLKCSLYSSCLSSSSDLRTLYKMIGHCRDIHKGKGERDLSYRMILTWFSVYPDLAISALRHLILDYGGWNDVKYFCLFVDKYCNECVSGSVSGSGSAGASAGASGIRNPEMYEPLILSAISLANDELRYNLGSNVAKWIPREHRNKNRELYDKFVSNWFDRKFVTNSMRQQYRSVVSKASAGIPSVTQRSIFHSIRSLRSSASKNEIVRTYEKPVTSGNSMSIGEYVKAAIYASESDAHWINMRWDVLVASFSECVSGVPVVDIDISISRENLYHAIGFACLIAQKSGAWRVLLVSGKPIWVDLMPAAGVFASMVAMLWEFCEIRTPSSFDISLDLIYQYTRSACHGLRLFVFSETFAFDWNICLSMLSGKIGSIIFWNIGTRVVIPEDLDHHKELCLMSGYMPALIAPFCSAVCPSFSSLFSSSSLSLSRYHLMDASFDAFFSSKTGVVGTAAAAAATAEGTSFSSSSPSSPSS